MAQQHQGQPQQPQQPQRQTPVDRETLTLTIPTTLMLNSNTNRNRSSRRTRNNNKSTPTVRQLFRELLTQTNNQLTGKLEATMPIQFYGDHNMEIKVVHPDLKDPTQGVKVRAQVDFQISQALSDHLMGREVFHLQRTLADHALQRCRQSRNRWEDGSHNQGQARQMRELRERLEFLELRDYVRAPPTRPRDPASQGTSRRQGSVFNRDFMGSTIGE